METPRALIQQADGHWSEYRRPLAVLSAESPAEVAGIIEEAERRAAAEGAHAVGFVTYEAAPGLDVRLSAHRPGRLPTAWFALFRDVCRGDAPVAGTLAPLDWRSDLDSAAYGAAVADIRDWIQAGDTYQVNFSYRLQARLPDGVPDLARRLLGAMVGSAAGPAGVAPVDDPDGGGQGGFGALLETADWAICSASPELFFSRRGRRLTSRPMKGTAPRGENPRSDAERADWLRGSAKNRAENLMITDMVRNDIGRLADVGTVTAHELFRLEPYPTLWQMTSTVCGDTSASLAEIFRALFPAASITGAPKRRTMEIIRALEPTPRQIYTGSIGVIEAGGDARFNVAIRTVLLDKRCGRAEYGVGGGILWDSAAAEELEETRTKARILRWPSAADFALLETLLWTPERGCSLLEAHLDRLSRAAGYFSRPVDRGAVLAALQAATADLPAETHRVRLLVDACGRPAVTVRPLAALPAPQRVTIARNPLALAGNPFVSHKTTRRDIYDTARRDAAARGEADDVLLVNLAGEVTESTIANVVVDLQGTLVTPPAAAGLLPGLFRAELLTAGTVVEGRLTPDDLHRARAVYLANSVRGLWQVTLV